MSVTDNKPVKYKSILACELRAGMFLYEMGAQVEVTRIETYTQQGTTYYRAYAPALIMGVDQVWATYDGDEDINVVVTADEF